MRKAQTRKSLHRSYKLFKRFGHERGESRAPSFRDMLELYLEEQHWLALDELAEERLSYLADYEHERAWQEWEAVPVPREPRYDTDGFHDFAVGYDDYEDDYDYDSSYEYDDYDSHVIQDTTLRCKRHQDCLANPQLAEACVAERIAGLQRKKAS